MGFKPSDRQSEVTNESEEVLVIPVAVADTLGDLDFVVKALQLTGADGEDSVGDKPVQARSFQLRELHQGGDAAGFRRVKPALPAFVGCERIPKLKERAKGKWGRAILDGDCSV